jgi:hypothetical protein
MDISFSKAMKSWNYFFCKSGFYPTPQRNQENTNIEKFLQETRGYHRDYLLHLKHKSLGPKARLPGRKGKMVR